MNEILFNYLMTGIGIEALNNLTFPLEDGTTQKQVEFAKSLVEKGTLGSYDHDDGSYRIIFLYYGLSAEKQNSLQEKLAMLDIAISFHHQLQEKKDLDYQNLAEIYQYLGKLHQETSPPDFSQAIILFKKAVAALKNIRQKDDVVYFKMTAYYYKVGVFYLNSNPVNFHQAINNFKKTITTLEKVSEKKKFYHESIANYHFKLADTYSKLRHLHVKKEINCYRRCIASFLDTEKLSSRYIKNIQFCFNQWASIYLDHTLEKNFCHIAAMCFTSNLDLNLFHSLVYKVKQEASSPSKQIWVKELINLMQLILKAHHDEVLEHNELKIYLDSSETNRYFEKTLEQLQQHEVLTQEIFLDPSQPPLVAVARQIQDLEKHRKTQDHLIYSLKEEILKLKKMKEEKTSLKPPSSASLFTSTKLKRTREYLALKPADQTPFKKPRQTLYFTKLNK